MFWGQSVGLDRVYETARMLGAKHGRRWLPGALLEKLAKSGQGWESLKAG